jgi:hypothetical protein
MILFQQKDKGCELLLQSREQRDADGLAAARLWLPSNVQWTFTQETNADGVTLTSLCLRWVK